MPPNPDPRHQRVDQLVRRFVAARERSDRAEMVLVWEALCVKTLDRVRGLVKGFHFPGGYERLPAHRMDDAVQEAYLRVQAQAAKFRGTTEAELNAALYQWVWNACMDYGRRELRHDERAGGSFDQPAFDDEGGRSRYEHLLEHEARRRELERGDKEQAEADLRADRDLVAWAISQVDNDNYRAVLELTFGDPPLSGEDIAARLDITPENVYQRRRRGLQRMEQILRERRP